MRFGKAALSNSLLFGIKRDHRSDFDFFLSILPRIAVRGITPGVAGQAGTDRDFVGLRTFAS